MRGLTLLCRAAGILWAAWVVGLLPAAEPARVTWIRGGLAWPRGVACRVDGQERKAPPYAVGTGQAVGEFAWQPGREYLLSLDGKHQVVRAPQRATALALHQVPLEEAGLVALHGVTPDSCVAFAPDSRRLAVGTLGGYLRVIDAYTGRLLHTRRIAEGMIKRVAWSPDGQVLYAGEQSPDAALLALDADTSQGEATFRTLWSVALATWIETSRPPAGDRYGVYTWPAVHDLHVTAAGEVIVAGAHNWLHEGALRNRSVVLSLDRRGKTRWRFPAEGAVPVSIPFVGVAPSGSEVLFLPNQTQASVAGNPLARDTIYALDGQRGALRGRLSVEAMRPEFERVESWDSTSVSGAGDRAVVGLADGRALLLRLTGAELALEHTLDLATVRSVGGIPIAASASYARFHGAHLVLQTQNTHVPFASAQSANQPPAAHRGANTLTVADHDGQIQWQYRGPFALTGSWADAAGRWLLVTCREVPGASEPGQFGCLLFDLQGAGGGQERLTYYYATEGPVSFAADISPDGRLVAVIETPAPLPDGRTLYGRHQLHLVH